MSKIDELEKEKTLWEQALKRYQKIGNVLYWLFLGIKNNGSVTLDIPECDFCQEYDEDCRECPWGTKINNGLRCGSSLGETMWGNLSKKISEAFTISQNITEAIKEQISKIEEVLNNEENESTPEV